MFGYVNEVVETNHIARIMCGQMDETLALLRSGFLRFSFTAHQMGGPTWDQPQLEPVLERQGSFRDVKPTACLGSLVDTETGTISGSLGLDLQGRSGSFQLRIMVAPLAPISAVHIHLRVDNESSKRMRNVYYGVGGTDALPPDFTGNPSKTVFHFYDSACRVIFEKVRERQSLECVE